MSEEKETRKRKLTLDEIERLPREEFDALPESKKRWYFDVMTRENQPTPAEFYGYDKEWETPADCDDEGWTDDADSCDGQAMPTPEEKPNGQDPTQPERLDAENLFGELIFAYTREQAIADGVLVDVTPTAREAGFKIPVALTRAAWAEFVEVPADVECQDEAGRLWDVLWMCRFGAARGNNRDASEFLFQLHVRNDNRPGEPPLATLKAVCGPDDDASPCFTIMMPEED